nr:glycosyltransferase family 1 protein [Sulfitobacter aestuariivivens]
MVHRKLRPLLARRASALLTVSHTSATALARYLGLPGHLFHIVSNSAAHILRLPCDALAPARHGLEAGRYLLSVGNLSPNKNLARLCAAHAACDVNVPPLAIAGGFAPGVARARDAGLRARVSLLGRVPDSDLRGLYEGAAGFVFPSLNEGFGIPALEAMQLGVPVLAARSGALPEVLGHAALWFDPKSTSDMVRAITKFAKLDKAARSVMRKNGLARAAHYSWDESANAVWRIVQDVAARQTSSLRRAV